jgi:hypothetical protein
MHPGCFAITSALFFRRTLNDLNMRKTILQLGLCLLFGGVFRGAPAHGAGSVAQVLPPREVEILRRVGEEYGLGVDTLRLLLGGAIGAPWPGIG